MNKTTRNNYAFHSPTPAFHPRYIPRFVLINDTITHNFHPQLSRKFVGFAFFIKIITNVTTHLPQKSRLSGKHKNYDI